MQPTIKKHLDNFFRDVTSIGGAGFYGLILLSTLALEQFPLFITLLSGFILTLLAVVIIRTFYFKNRPNKENHNNYIEKIDASSFPSLHSARVVFLASTFVNNFKSSYLTTFIIFITLLVIYSRIHIKKHDWKDVLGGIVLGGLVFWIVVNF